MAARKAKAQKYDPRELAFDAVPWMPTFRMRQETLVDELEVLHAPGATTRFSMMRWHGRGAGFVPDHPWAARILEMADDDQPGYDDWLAEARRQRASDEQRDEAWVAGMVVAAAAANASMRRLGGTHLDRAYEARRLYLLAVDAGTPPDAATVAGIQRAAPGCLQHLGKTLPSEEGLALVRSLGIRGVIEVGAGFGLFARSLERAGVEVAATDLEDPNVGIAYPVERGPTAAESMRINREAGRSGSADVAIAAMWPQAYDMWLHEVFDGAWPGQVVLTASPELDQVLGTDGTREAGIARRGGRDDAGWLALGELSARITKDFNLVGEAPMAPAGWPLSMARLAAWRRKA